MTRCFKISFVLIIFWLSPFTSLFAIQDGQSTITVTVEDDYTNEPVESVLVRLLDNGSEIASGTTDLTGRAELVLSVTSNEEPSDLIPESFQVSESYPNPFEQSSSVNLQIEEAQEVQAEIYNIIGQRVASLQVNLTPGTYTLQSSLGHLAQGVYFLRILGTQSQTIKMTKVGERIFSGGSILNINPATFVTRNGPGMARLTLNGQTSRSLTLVTSNGSYDTFQQSLQVTADTTIAVEMSRNNEVIVRVADETSPSQDVETTLMVEGDQFSQQITSPDTLTLKSGFYTLSTDEANTAAFSQDVEIASEDQTVTVLTQVKTLADDQLQLEGLITDETSGTPIDRAYIYLLNQTTSDTLSGPLFADSDGVIDAIANLDNGPDLDLSILYRKAGYTDFEGTASVSLPDTLNIETALQPAPSPTASFTVSGDQTAGSPVIFDASASAGASGEDLTYSWDFGNGKSGGGPTIGYVYSTSGSYNVTLTVVGDFGASEQITQSISVSAVQPAGSATLSGTIFTNEGEELEGVLVTTADGSVTGVSNPEGDVILEGLDTDVPIVLTLTREGYSNQYVRTEIPAETNSAFFEANMLPRGTPMIAEQIEIGGQFEGIDGANVTLPIDGFVTESGETVTGEVEMTFTPLDVRNEGNLRSFPGSFSAVSSDGSQGELVSFGLAEYNFEQDGNPIQLAPGKKATIEIPYYLDMNVDGDPVQAGDQVPLWSLDESTGLWVEEGNGTVVASANSPTGYTMRAEVTHFSWWNIDYIDDRYTAILECKIIDNNGLPTLDIPEGGACFIRGLMGSGCTGSSIATTQIPSGTTVEIDLSGDCSTTLFGSSPMGNRGNVSVSGSAGSTVNITVPLNPVETGNGQVLTVNDFVTDELELNKDSYLVDPEGEDAIVIEIEKLGRGFPFADVTVFDPNDNVIGTLTLNNQDSFAAYKKRLLVDIDLSGLYRVEIEHTEGSNLLYTFRVQPLEPVTLNTPLEFSIIRGISRYLLFEPQEDIIVRSNNDGSIFQSDFTKLGDLKALETSDLLNLFQLRKDSSYVIEFVNINGPEVLQKEFILDGGSRDQLSLNPNNILTLDLIDGPETFVFDPLAAESFIVEIDRSQQDNIDARLDLLDPSGSIIDSDELSGGTFSNPYRARVFTSVEDPGNYSLRITPLNGSTGNYSIKTYEPEQLALDMPSEFSVLGGGSFYHTYSPDRDIVIRGSATGKLLDTNFDDLFLMGNFLPGALNTIGFELLAGNTYIIAQENRLQSLLSGTMVLSEVDRTEIVLDGGEFITSAEIRSSANAHVYTFNGIPDAAVVSIITDKLNANVDDFYIGKIGNGTYYDVGQLMSDRDFGASNDEIRSVLEASSSDQYSIIVLPQSNQSGTGSYNLKIDYAEAQQNYVISRDLSCPDATLRNVEAAALAAPQNATISICEGVYEESAGLEIINPGVSISGTDKSNSIIRGFSSGFFKVGSNNVTINNLSFETNASTLSFGALDIEGDNFTLSNAIVRPIDENNGYGTGIYIDGNNATIEQTELINNGSGTAIRLASTNGITINDNQFINQSAGITSTFLSGNITVTNNLFEYNEGNSSPSAGFFRANNRSFGNPAPAVRRFESNTINFQNTGTQVLTFEQTPNQQVDDIIRGNTITWTPRGANDVAINVEVGRENSTSLIESNRIQTLGDRGGIGIRTNATNSLLETGTISIINNTIQDKFTSILLLNPDWFTNPINIYNNTMTTDAPSFSNQMIGVDVRGNSSSDEGSIMVRIVNNIITGRGGRNDIGIDINERFTIDSDYNLFHDIGPSYVGGSTDTGSNDLNGNPLFINDLLELDTSSPAIDSGATSSDYSGIPDVDINGTTRPQGSGIDRGAVEKVE